MDVKIIDLLRFLAACGKGIFYFELTLCCYLLFNSCCQLLTYKVFRYFKLTLCCYLLFNSCCQLLTYKSFVISNSRYLLLHICVQGQYIAHFFHLQPLVEIGRDVYLH